ncbi:MAG: hypothetical protein ABR915_16895 [Thermoguttaceae bacterium]
MEGTARKNWWPQDDIDHRNFVQHEQLALQRVLLVPLEFARCRIKLQEPVDGLGRPLGRFRQPLGRPAGGRSQDAFESLGGEDFQDATDQGGLPDARPACDDQHLLLARLPNRLLLPGCQIDPQLPLDPGDGLFHVDLGERVRSGGDDPVNGLGEAHFGPMKSRQVEPGLAFDVFSDDRFFGHRRPHRLFDDQLVDLE